MIYIGLAGWGDHDDLYENVPAREKLSEYSSHFPIVEVDASFYAIQPEKNAIKWCMETPKEFKFIIKAYQGMTKHKLDDLPYKSYREMFTAFKQSLVPYIETNKLSFCLFQFPPSFHCTSENVHYLRWVKKEMENIPCAIEFRHGSWYKGEMKELTLRFLEEEGWIHTIVDEPQTLTGSIPTVLNTCKKEQVFIRFHGRNIYGWNAYGQANWRAVRYLYDYSKEELLEWVNHVLQLKKETKDIFIVFNNNSGGHASKNAKLFLNLLNIEYNQLNSSQMKLF